MKFSTWRRLWLSLAKAERALGLPITQEQVDEMAAHLTDIDYDVARQREEGGTRHDVMAHVYYFGRRLPRRPALSTSRATSAYVGDNTDTSSRSARVSLASSQKLATVLTNWRSSRMRTSQPTLGFTHFQPAQLTTVGKRATLWMNELLMDLNEVEYRIENLRMLGSTGTTGNAGVLHGAV